MTRIRLGIVAVVAAMLALIVPTGTASAEGECPPAFSLSFGIPAAPVLGPGDVDGNGLTCARYMSHGPWAGVPLVIDDH